MNIQNIICLLPIKFYFLYYNSDDEVFSFSTKHNINFRTYLEKEELKIIKPLVKNYISYEAYSLNKLFLTDEIEARSLESMLFLHKDHRHELISYPKYNGYYNFKHLEKKLHLHDTHVFFKPCQ